MNTKRACVIALLGLQAVLLAWSGWRNSPINIDEPAHLAAGIHSWQTGRLDLYAVNPPLVRMVAAIPVLWADPRTNWTMERPAEEERAEFAVGADFAEANGPRIFWLVTLARWACIPLVLLGGCMCYRWAAEMYGAGSGLLALTLWCLSPTVLGNGALITADVASASLAVTAGYYFWRWLRERNGSSALTAGAALGIGLLVKLTLGLFVLLWPVLWAIDRWSANGASGSRPLRGELAQLALLLTTAVVILNLGYGFEGSFRRLDSFAFESTSLGGPLDERGEDEFGNRFVGTALAALPVPVPANFLIGIDRQRQDFEEGRERFFRGELRQAGEPGWWWFYLYAATVKVPLGTWLLALLAFPVALRQPFRQQLPVVVPPLAILLLVSSQTGLNFFRYLLPAFGFAFVWISQAAAHWQQGRAATCWLSVLAVGWMGLSSLIVYPHSLSYFNELVGGPKNGFRLMADANSDWGQDLLDLQRWIDQHPQARGLRLDYFGSIDPERAGLDVVSANSIGSRTATDPADMSLAESAPQWYAVSATHLVKRAAADTRNAEGMPSERTVRARYLLSREPDARAGYSILIYRVGER